jgi:hypothetical protein
MLFFVMPKGGKNEKPLTFNQEIPSYQVKQKFVLFSAKKYVDWEIGFKLIQLKEGLMTKKRRD